MLNADWLIVKDVYNSPSLGPHLAEALGLEAAGGERGVDEPLLDCVRRRNIIFTLWNGSEVECYIRKFIICPSLCVYSCVYIGTTELIFSVRRL